MSFMSTENEYTVVSTSGNSNNSNSNSSGSTSGTGTGSGSKVAVPLGAMPTHNCEYCMKNNWVACGRSGSYRVGGTSGSIPGSNGSNMSIAKEIALSNRSSGVSANDYYNHA